MAKSRIKPAESHVSKRSGVTSGPTPLEQNSIAALAYQFWQARGCPFGSPEEDWFRAEAELRAHTPQQIRTMAASA